MTMGIIYGFECIYIDQDQGKIRLSILIDVQDLLKSATVQRLSLNHALPDDGIGLLRLLVLLVDFVVCLCQILQLCRTDHREDLS